jgi:hypothetical protein
MSVSAALTEWQRHQKDPVLRRIQPKGIPILFEDEGLEMGESSLHSRSTDILLYGIEFHLEPSFQLRVFDNLNLYYSEEDPEAYVSPDILVVRPRRKLPANVRSYRISKDGPPPVLLGEVLSVRTYQEGDLTSKPVLYASLGVEEFLLADVSGELLRERLLLLRLKADGTWKDEQDADSGVTSRLGFRVIIEGDGQLRVLDAKTGRPYPRPSEAADLEQRLREAEAELARLKGRAKTDKGKKRKPN